MQGRIPLAYVRPYRTYTLIHSHACVRQLDSIYDLLASSVIFCSMTSAATRFTCREGPGYTPAIAEHLILSSLNRIDPFWQLAR
jgi:hypothetical protein